MWFVGFLLCTSMTGFRRGHEVLETHKKLVDWLWGRAQGIYVQDVLKTGSKRVIVWFRHLRKPQRSNPLGTIGTV